jgi:hypothetical protein
VPFFVVAQLVGNLQRNIGAETSPISFYFLDGRLPLRAVKASAIVDRRHAEAGLGSAGSRRGKSQCGPHRDADHQTDKNWS